MPSVTYEKDRKPLAFLSENNTVLNFVVEGKDGGTTELVAIDLKTGSQWVRMVDYENVISHANRKFYKGDYIRITF